MRCTKHYLNHCAQCGNWEDRLTEEEREYVAGLRMEIEVTREQLVDAKREFDRRCDDLYLFGRKIRDQMVEE